MAASGYPGMLDAYNQGSIQDTFHFDTNQFLIPVDGECPPLDYEDLFSLLNQPADRGGSAGSSGGSLPLPSAGSGGWAASPAAAAAVTSAPARQLSQQHSEPKQSKTARDAALKRVRDAAAGSKSKQHQVKELEALAAQKVEDLERLLHENSELKFRSQILEKVVQMRDHQLKVMRGLPEDLPQFWGGSRGGQQHPAGGAAAAATGGGGGGPGQCPQAAAAAAAAANGGAFSAVATVKMASCGCLLQASGESLSAADRERFRSLGRLQLMDGWKHFLSEVAVPLLALESNGEDEQAAERVRHLAADATHMFKHASLLAPDTVMLVSQTHLETEALTSADPGHWHTVVRSLELSPEQVRELRAVFRLFSDIMRGVLAERKTINERLAAGVHHSGATVDVRAALEQLTVSPECEVLQLLQRSMRREKSAHLLLRGFLMGRTLSVLQFVKAAVYSYPWMPDATALVATVVEAAEASGGSSD